MKYTAQDIARILNATAQIATLHEPTLEEKIKAFLPTYNMLIHIAIAANTLLSIKVNEFEIWFHYDPDHGFDYGWNRGEFSQVSIRKLIGDGYYKDYSDILEIRLNGVKQEERLCEDVVYIGSDQYEIRKPWALNNSDWTYLLNNQDKIIEAAIAAVQKLNAKKVAIINAVNN